MKDLSRWLHAHPIKACFFSSFFTFAFSFCGFFEHKILLGVAAIFLGFAVWCLIYTADMKKLIALLLILTLPICSALSDPIERNVVDQEPPLQAQAGGCVVAGAVIIGGGFAIYMIIKLCKRVFPAPESPEISTNGIPNLTASSGGYEAASYVDAPIYDGCYADCDFLGGSLIAASETTWTVVQLDVAVEAGVPHLKACKSTAAPPMLDVDEFTASLRRLKLDFNPMVPGRSYARDGQTIGESESRVKFAQGLRGTVPVISNGGQVYPVQIERSQDMYHWERLAGAEVAEGITLRFVDTSPRKQMFYRIAP